MLAWAYTPDTRQYPHDLGAARRLLDEAGFAAGKNGERFAITFTHAAAQQRLAQALRQQLSEVGITLNLQTLDFNAAVEQVFVKKTFDLGFASFCNGADPDIGVRRVYVSSNIGPFPFSNGAGYRNARIDQLFDLGFGAGRSHGATRALRRDPENPGRRRAVLLADRFGGIQSPSHRLYGISAVDRCAGRDRDAHDNALRRDCAATVRRRRGSRAARCWPCPSSSVVTTLTFALIHLAPGDPIYALAGDGGSAGYYADMRARYGLDQPLLAQFVTYARLVFSGDLGFSFMFQAPVAARAAGSPAVVVAAGRRCARSGGRRRRDARHARGDVIGFVAGPPDPSRHVGGLRGSRVLDRPSADARGLRSSLVSYRSPA